MKMCLVTWPFFGNEILFEYMLIGALGKCESKGVTALSIWFKRVMPLMDLTRYFLLSSHITGVGSRHMFVNVEDFEK